MKNIKNKKIYVIVIDEDMQAEEIFEAFKLKFIARCDYAINLNHGKTSLHSIRITI